MDRKILLDVIDDLFPHKRKPKYTNIYYLDSIILLLNDLVKWESLTLLNKDKPKYHYKTIEKKFSDWSKKNVFGIAYNIILKSKKIIGINSQSTIDLFIDSTNIINKTGIELVAYGGANRKKKITKLSIISDSEKCIYGVTPFLGSVHDAKTILPCMKKIFRLIDFRKINLMGDKGYISKKKNRAFLASKKICLITNNKKNMKKNTEKEKRKLSKRYTVENSIQTIKCLNRIQIRRDKTIKSYMGFIYLALILKSY